MNDIEAKIRCLELAATLNARQNVYVASNIVETASVLYAFVVAPSLEATPAASADKPGKKRQAKEPDILS